MRHANDGRDIHLLSIGDSLHSALVEGAIIRTLKAYNYGERVSGFISEVRQIPWIIESLSNTAIVRWRSRWSTKEEQAEAITLMRAYLESSKFFGQEIAEEVRMGFALFIIDLTIERCRRPTPEKGAWN